MRPALYWTLRRFFKYSSPLYRYWESSAVNKFRSLDPGHSSTGLNHVFLWELLKKKPEMGMKPFDFIEANTPSISKYRSAFNFSLVPYQHPGRDSGKGAGLLMNLKRSLKR